MALVPWASDLAQSLLAEPLPRRWAHTQGVARQAHTLAPILGDDADLLQAAAWLHDIGYSPDLATTGFHPLDGARYLRDHHHADPASATSSPTIPAPSSKPKNAASPTNSPPSSPSNVTTSPTPSPTAT